MFKLNLKIALRSLWKNRVSSLINITGLAIGLAACLLLLVYVLYEWNFDKHAENSADTYITLTHIRDDSGKIMMTMDGTVPALGPLMKEQLPEVRFLSRTNYPGMDLIAHKENSFKKLARFADPDILKIFDYKFIYGDPARALQQPQSIVLTESTANALFGRTDVLNKTLRYQNKQELTVTGVIQDLPDNSSQKFDYLMPWSMFEVVSPDLKTPGWDNFSFVTLVTLNKGTNMEALNKKLATLVKKNRKITGEQPFFLYPLSRMHLFGKFENGKNTGGAVEQIWLFLGLATGVLLVACINFMNMATARSEKRAREVGIRKTIGATRTSLMLQFLFESVILAFVSTVVAIALVEAFLPVLNNLLGLKMGITYFNVWVWLGISGVMLLTGLVAGSYPAFYLSAFDPIGALRKKGRRQRLFSVGLRQVLITGQFCFAVLLIISTLVIYRQLQFIKNRPAGADIKILAEMPMEGVLSEKFELFRNKLLEAGAISEMCQTTVSLIHHSSNFNGLEWPGSGPRERSVLFNQVGTTYDFVKTNGLKLIAGREFSRQHASDTAAVMVSASAVKTMGLKDPVGAVLRLGGRQATIIGVFQDYIWDSPYKSNTPMIVYFNGGAGANITFRLNPARSIRENTEAISNIAREMNPAYPAELSFADNAYKDLMKKEQKLGILSNIFGGLAIFISCMGLYGLVAFSAEQRTREFGVRKVLGASVANLVGLLSASFLKMVLIAIVITIPLACYLMDNWLGSFEFRTGISWWIIAAAASGTLLIAFLTLAYQAYKSAVANPTDALKYE